MIFELDNGSIIVLSAVTHIAVVGSSCFVYLTHSHGVEITEKEFTSLTDALMCYYESAKDDMSGMTEMLSELRDLGKVVDDICDEEVDQELDSGNQEAQIRG